MKIDAKLTLNYANDTSRDIPSAARAIIEGGREELIGAITEVMTEVKNLSQELVPYRLGNLKATANTIGVNVEESGDNGVVWIGYGTAYAVLQHETPPANEAPPSKEGHKGPTVQTFRHADGKTWKFLQRPMEAAIPGLEARIADKVRKRIGAR